MTYLVTSSGSIVKCESNELTDKFMKNHGGHFTKFDHFPTEKEYFNCLSIPLEVAELMMA